jgi:D-alanyl-D-alanine carboxypeptidase
MYRVPREATRGLRFGVSALAAVVALLAVTTDPADARSRRKRYVVKKATVSQSYSPRYADVVIDAKTGDVLHESAPDALRHPASLTKIMTLYMLFERMETGKVRLDSQMEVSAEAASQAPTKLGLRAGQTLAVEDAIKGLVTKSANDAAVVIAEYLAGSEEEFGRQMTRKARSLGMSKTIYRNASGLPNDEQVTTAREQAILGMAIQERFPRHYRYFATPSFVYRGSAMRNHNRLLGNVEGVDGIKTGYTRASGFNLVTSMRRGDRHVVAVVLGGTSGGARDARMRSLLESHIAEATPLKTTKIAVAVPVPAPEPATPSLVAQLTAPFTAPVETRPAKPATVLASASSTPVKITPPVHDAAPRAGSSEPLKPVAVKTVAVKVAAATKTVPVPAPVAAAPAPAPKALPPVHTASVAVPKVVAQAPAPQMPVSAMAMQDTRFDTRYEPIVEMEQQRAAKAEAKAEPKSEPKAAPAKTEIVKTEIAKVEPKAVPQPAPGSRPGILGVLPAAVAAAGSAIVPSASANERSAEKPATTRSGWAIQIGAYEGETEAKQKLSDAKSKAAGVLRKADAYTERTQKGAKTYYRARFAGFDRDEAEAACKQLKRSDVACLALKI